MKTITVNTGYGYFKENDKIVMKAELKAGEHQIEDKYTYVEVPNKTTLDSVEIYREPTNFFNVELFVSRLGDEFTGMDAIQLAPYFAAVKEFLVTENYVKLKQFLEGLVLASIANQTQYDKIKALLMEQNLNLDNY